MLDARRFAAGDEFVDFAKRARMKRRLAMIERTEHKIGRALQRRPIARHPGRLAGLADEAPVRLGKLVDAVAAQREERRARRHLALAFVQAAQERAAAIEFAARTIVPIVDAMVGNAAQYRVADLGAAAILDIVADRIAAARIADQRDPRCTGAALQFLDRFAKLAALVFGRGTVGLFHLVVGARQRIGEIDGEHPVTRHAVRFHSPERRDPERRMVAIAMDEQNRRHFGRGARRGRGLRERRSAETPGQQWQRSGPLQHRPPRQAHFGFTRHFSVP